MTDPQARPEPTQEQLTRALLEEIRLIKTMLGWALFGIPGLVLLVWLVVWRLG